MTLNTKYQLFMVNVITQPATRDGEILNASSATVVEALNGKETFTFDLKSTDPANLRITLSLTQIQVARNGVVIWWGIVTNLQGDGGVNTYTAQDLSWLFTKRWVGPTNPTPFYSTRFQLANTTVNSSETSPSYFTANGKAALYNLVPNSGTPSTTGGNKWVSTASGIVVYDLLWKTSLNETEDIYWNTSSSRWSGRTFTGYVNSTFGNVPGTTTTTAGTPDIITLNTAAYTLRNDASNIPILPLQANAPHLTFINWGTGSTIDTGGIFTASSALGGRLWRRWIISNPTNFPKQIHAVAYVRLNDATFMMDPFATGQSATMVNPSGFNPMGASDSGTQAVVPQNRYLCQFGIVDTTITAEASNSPAYLKWIDVAPVSADGIPSSQWARVVMSSTIPAQAVNVNFAMQFQASTPTGYILGGLDIFIDDGLFYRLIEQGTIVNDILNYIQSTANGWQPLNINVSIPMGSGATSSPRSKEYLFSDYKTAYDALMEYTTLMYGYDFGWVYTASVRTFTGWYSPGSPGITVGTSVGRGVIKSTLWVHGAEIVGYNVTGDGTQLSDAVGVYEASTATIFGAAREFAVVSNVPTGRWQLGEVYEGTPGGGPLSIQQQAQRGFNRYSSLSYSLNIVLHPSVTDVVFQHDIGDVVAISIAELGLDKVQFRITGRATKLDSDTVGLTVQQYYGL